MTSRPLDLSSPRHGTSRLHIGSGRVVNQGVFGANDMLTARNHILENEGYRELIRALGVPVMRFPGGTHASYWDWETGHYIGADEINHIWPKHINNWMIDHHPVTNAYPAGTFGPKAIANYAQDLGVELQWVPNLTTRADDQPALFEFLKKAAVDVKYVEMDNETYFWNAVFGEEDRCENYLERAKALREPIRQLYPDAQIGIVAREEDFFLEGHVEEDIGMQRWFETLKKPDHQSQFDALILHHYVMRKGRLDAFEAEQDRAAAFLAYPQVTLEKAGDTIAQHFPGKVMWITEYNVIAYYWEAAGDSPADQWMSTRRDSGWAALYQAAFWLTGLCHPESVGILNHHSIGEIDIGWGLGEPIDKDTGMLSKTGQLYAHLTHLAKSHDLMHAIEIEDATDLGISIEGTTHVSALYGAALSRTDHTTLLIMNRSGADHPISHPATSLTEVTTYLAEETDPGPDRATVNLHGPTPVWEQGPMVPVRSTATPDADHQIYVTLPPFSLTILEISA